MTFRTKLDQVFSTTSSNEGLTWGPLAPVRGIPNPNSKVDIVRTRILDKKTGSVVLGPLAMAYNDHRSPGNNKKYPSCKKCRLFLTVALSFNEGATWTPFAGTNNVCGSCTISFESDWYHVLV